MAVVVVGHHPKLTPSEAMEVFQQHVGGRYEVYRADSWPLSGAAVKRDFALKKSAWIGITVKLQQEPGKTSFVVTYFIPSLLAVAFGGLFALLLLRSSYKAMEAEIISFIEGAEEFK